MARGSDLWDRYVGRGVSYEDIAKMSLKTLTRQVKELKDEWQSDEEMSASEIAGAIKQYAKSKL
jgi:hypothetical protein